MAEFTYQLVDFLNPQGTFGITERLDKIKYNINQVEPLKQNIEKQKKTNKIGLSCLTVLGRWIVIYRCNLTNDEQTIMYFIDFRIDISILKNSETFSTSTIASIEQIQKQYDNIYTPKLDGVKLTFAEPFERVVQPNLFLCESDEIVLALAKKLGVLPMITGFRAGDTLKMTIVDDKEIIDNKEVMHIYALINFCGASKSMKHDDGFVYLKFFDLIRNIRTIDTFITAVRGVGGQIDRAYIMERFTNEKLN